MNDPAEDEDLPHLDLPTWDTASRRGAWVDDVSQADKLRTGVDPGDATEVYVDNAPKNQSEIRRKVKRIGFLPALASIACFGLLLLLGNNCFKAITYKQHFDAGLVALSSGNSERAQVEFSLAAECEPNSADVYYYLAQAESERGSPGNALKNFEKALSLQPDSAKYFLARGSLYLKIHQFEAAIEDCDAALRADPKSNDAYRIKASAWNHLNQFQKAITESTNYLDRYNTEDGYRADALAKRAFAHDQLREYDAAIKDYSDALACAADNSSVYAGRAVAYMHARKWRNAVEDCNRALALNSEAHPALFKVRGICNSKLQLHENSLADLDMLVALHPTVDTHRVRGTQRLIAHDYLGTLEDFDYVLMAEPDDGTVSKKYLHAKSALQATARRTDGVADAEPHARMPSPRDLNITQQQLVVRGYKLFINGDTEPAIEYLAAALKANPKDFEARRYLAHACVQMGQYRTALKHYAVLQQLTDLTRLDILLAATAFTCENQPGKAIEMYTELLKADPADDKARTNLIETLLSVGKAGEAAPIAAAGAKQVPSQCKKYNALFRRCMSSRKAK